MNAHCDCVASGNTAKPRQHGADPHVKNCNVYIGRHKMASIPRIDPSVRHISIGQLRKEKDFADTLVVSDGPLPVAVVVPYAVFLQIQSTLQNAVGEK